MKNALDEAHAALKTSLANMKEKVDKHCRDAKQYSPGDQVWLDATNIRTRRPSKSLDNKRLGPFKVLECIGDLAYRLKLPRTWSQMHPIFNESLLTPFVPPEASHQVPPPPPPADVIDGHLEYEVEEILASKKVGCGVKYLVKWKGYSRDENSWEPSSNLSHAAEIVADFHRHNPDATRPALLPAARPARPVLSRNLFPENFFTEHRREPLTTGIDTSLPEERALHRMVLLGHPRPPKPRLDPKLGGKA